MDTFPYESWEEAANAARTVGEGFFTGEGYFTWGPGENLGTILLVAIGFSVMIVAFVSWIRTEDRKLNEQAARLQAAARMGE